VLGNASITPVNLLSLSCAYAAFPNVKPTTNATSAKILKRVFFINTSEMFVSPTLKERGVAVKKYVRALGRTTIGFETAASRGILETRCLDLRASRSVNYRLVAFARFVDNL
jgi:hypothetical protein